MEEREVLAALCKHLHPEAVIALARALVETPSHTPEGETQAATILEQFLEQAGIPSERQRVDDVGVNVTATLPSETGEVALLLNGHLDTVPPSSAMPHPPFSATIKDGVLWGRGAADMKGGLAAMACALAAIRAADLPLKRSVMLSAVASEEQGNRGTAELIRTGLRARWAVVGEPTGLDLVIAHKGVDRYRVIVDGRAAHESLPEYGENAIVSAAHIITVLDRSLFVNARQNTHPLLGHATYNIGTIQGGISRNIVPDRCTFQIAKRWLPGDSPDRIRAELTDAIRTSGYESRASVVHEPDMERIPHPPLELPPDHPLVQALAATITRVTHRTAAVCGWAAFTDAALLQSAGIPALVFGPGELNLAHTDAEQIPVADLVMAAKVYAAFAVMAAQA